MLDLRHAKIVHRQPGQDHVVGGVGRQVFDRTVQHAAACGGRLEVGICMKAVVEAIDKAPVQLDQIEAIGRLMLRIGAGSLRPFPAQPRGSAAHGALRTPGRRQVRGRNGQRRREAASARQDCPGGAEVPPKLAEEQSAIGNSTRHDEPAGWGFLRKAKRSCACGDPPGS